MGGCQNQRLQKIGPNGFEAGTDNQSANSPSKSGRNDRMGSVRDISNQNSIKLTEQDLRKAIDKIYIDFDTDRDGKLNLVQVAQLMRQKMNIKDAGQRQAREFILSFNPNGQDKIQKESLFKIYKQIYV